MESIFIVLFRMGRAWILFLTAAYLGQYPWLQIILNIVGSMFYGIGLLHYEPFTERS